MRLSLFFNKVIFLFPATLLGGGFRPWCGYVCICIYGVASALPSQGHSGFCVPCAGTGLLGIVRLFSGLFSGRGAWLGALHVILKYS